ncbi:hypothetical protein KKJ17_18815 [Xenorhabdus bovienii]|uniref:hypothetical protein n=1 Tax=Xenorhabdus bovienii TaxID=40576 RepID=UPI0023B3548A|nr:hypothetical protein [Xenorhabdus bovienii]MDE9519709.1 hypothetical protein [Xenorhabdus bovienii]
MSGIGGNMDYSTLSDFEINKRVAQYIDITPDNIFDNEEMIFKPVGNDKFEKFDPCNKPEHAMPIILENNINLIHGENELAELFDHHSAYTINDLGKLIASDSLKGIKSIYRLGMEVYLMVKDAENEN